MIPGLVLLFDIGAILLTVELCWLLLPVRQPEVISILPFVIGGTLCILPAVVKLAGRYELTAIMRPLGRLDGGP